MLSKNLIVGILIALIGSVNIYSQTIKAYHTNLGDNYEALDMDQEKIFGKYADLVVDIGEDKRVLFSRITSYLPILQIGDSSWKFQELIERNGDGKPERPDVLSRYSHVRLISSNPEAVTVHWRYFPDFNNVEWDGVVDEYFTFFPDGIVSRKFKKGTKSIDDWNNDSNVLEASYKLSENGILFISQSSIPVASQIENGLTLKKHSKIHPKDLLLSISFNQMDALESNKIIEEKSKEFFDIVGHKTLIKKGIIGSALHFDGYYSAVKLPSIDISNLDQLTIESFVALGAYPFGNAPIVHQSVWKKNGFYLGIDEDGYPHFNIGTDNEWISIVADEKLELYRWYYIAATINKDSREAVIYVNGEPNGSYKNGFGEIIPAETELVIGINSQKMPDIEGRIRRGKW
ncbi:MAG: LamG domain-containing protein, partial [Melioribacteraceae bacterium]|nr:LamG domain-containing protein [Melioribacteraceae bacterium]